MNPTALPRTPPGTSNGPNTTTNNTPFRESTFPNSAPRGWSPLQIRRTGSPTKPSTVDLTAGDGSPSGPRRTSTSFKHVKHNSLVSNSPFKAGAAGAPAAGGRSGPVRPLSLDSGERKISGSMKTVGLGISASPQARPPSREILNERRGGLALPNKVDGNSASGSRSREGVDSPQAVSPKSHPLGHRKTQSLSFPTSSDGQPEPIHDTHHSPDAKHTDPRHIRQSMGLKGLARGGLVSSSPFLAGNRSPEKAGQGDSPVKNKGNMMADEGRKLEYGTPMRSSSGAGSRQVYESPRQPARPDVFSSSAENRAVPIHRDYGSDFGPSSTSSYISTAQLEAELEEVCAPIKSLPPLTPSRSSITSRRLRGPRVTGSDSPSITRQMKTVTFQAVPNVREFDVESMTDAGEGNSSMEYERDGNNEEDEDDSRDQPYMEEMEGDSMEAICIESREGGKITYYEREEYREERIRPPQASHLHVPHEKITQDASPLSVPEESMTANFIDSLVEDGYFSPPQISEPRMAPAISLDDTPILQENVDFAPQLSTPSLGGSMSMSPMFKHASVSDSGHGVSRDLDESGIPFGRTHHAERAAHAHAQPIQSRALPIPQPALSREGHQTGQPIIRNADASQPSTGLHVRQEASGPHSTQSGAFVDPFVTLETVTHIYKEEVTYVHPEAEMQPEKSGASFGRTSHIDRAKEARLMATQSLGLGMPRRPAHPGSMGPPAAPAAALARRFSGESEDGSDVPESESEDEPEFAEKRSSFQPSVLVPQAVPVLSQENLEKRISFEKRSLPQPPRPEQVRVPSPVNVVPPPIETPTELLVERSMYSLSLPFMLPGLELSSPLLSTSLFRKDTVHSSVEPDNQTSREDIRRSGEQVLPLPINIGFTDTQIGFRTTSEAFRMVEAALPPPSPTKAESSELPQAPKVRQRISKDMIRQRMEEKKQQHERAVHIGGVAPDDRRAEVVGLGKEEDLPLPPSEAAWLASADKSPVADAVRPALAPRSQSRSAQDVLREAEKEGIMHAPKSALDKLVAGLNTDGSAPQTSADPTGPPGIESRTKLVPGTQRDVASETLGTSRVGSRRLKRRSVSNDDMRSERKPAQRMSILDMNVDLGGASGSSMLGDLQAELENIASHKPYRVHEQVQTVYASAESKIRTTEAGDTDSGKAWRQLRKPSDMNQYAKELKALKAKQAGMAKATGTVFVKVLGIESLQLPLPDQATSFCITLDNGIDYIRTPYARLSEGAKVNQEFALVEHANFEFTLGLEIRRDPHIVQMLHGNMQKTIAPSDTASMASTARTAGGFRNMFSSPKKVSKAPKAFLPPPAQSPVDQPENICHYFATGDSTVGKTHISFKPIARNCDARLLEIRYPMSGYIRRAKTAAVAAATDQRGLPAPPGEVAPVKKQICKVTLQIFRLPPLPGLSLEQLPQSIDECLRGMRHHAWHEHEYFEGVLTQRGGDCAAPRRRAFKIIGSNLVASNAVTKKTVFSIDLRKAIKLVNENDESAAVSLSPDDEYEHVDRMPRSFTLAFDDGGKITFWTDTDTEKTGWMDALNILIGKIPSNPLWAEMLAAKQRHSRSRSVSTAKGSEE